MNQIILTKPSLWNIHNHVPKERTPQYACYDNKLLSEWTSDDFADFVLDQCDMDLILHCDKKSFLNEIDMLKYIPQNYARVYLYGVWECVKEVLRCNYELE